MLACVEENVDGVAGAVVIVVLGPPYLPLSMLASQSIGVSIFFLNLCKLALDGSRDKRFQRLEVRSVSRSRGGTGRNT